MANNVEITMLFDIYGEMLTEKQRDFLNYYYNDDLSLSEIAELNGITRQGAHDLIKRCDKILEGYEAKLHLLENKLAEEAADRLAQDPEDKRTNETANETDGI